IIFPLRARGVGPRTAHGFFQDMLHAVFRAPMAFFDSTPTGRTLARVSLGVLL
ncbi:unnamed protein product, partial [Closterium sp. NIES-54]